jgi:hypothetical protein
MIVECLVCGTKNHVPDEPDAAGTYRCRSCEETLDLSFGEREEEPGTGEAADRGSQEPDIWEDRFTEAALTKGPPFSLKRLLGAALFGALTTGYATKACEFTVPRIISIIQRVDEAPAAAQYESSTALAFLTLGFGALLGSGVAAFLSRRWMVWAGVLANLPYSLLYLWSLVVAVEGGDDRFLGNLSFPLYSFLQVLILVVASVTGAVAARRLYSPEWDPDLGTGKVTIFGVRWAHYFWILPFVVYPYLSSFIMALYAGVLVLLTDYYVAIHPSLWFSLSWSVNATLNPLAVYVAFWMVIAGFGKFLAVMMHGQSTLRGFGRFWRAVWYGVFLPALSFAVAAISASITHSLPKPAPGDWKIGVGLTVGLIAIGLLVQGWSWIRERMAARD